MTDDDLTALAAAVGVLAETTPRMLPATGREWAGVLLGTLVAYPALVGVLLTAGGAA